MEGHKKKGGKVRGSSTGNIVKMKEEKEKGRKKKNYKDRK